ncbi:MAG TPA: hypothetical protein VLU47_18625 [Blastocatellia bacterium]|nr:hypothetical protein [Blastocatellia bacterium]
MKNWPEFDSNGDLPLAVHKATLTEVLARFGAGTAQRRLVGQRLDRIYKVAFSTGRVARFLVFGSFDGVIFSSPGVYAWDGVQFTPQ